MHKPTPVARVMLVVFVVVWVFAITMRVIGLGDEAAPWVYVDRPAPEEYPTVQGLIADEAQGRTQLRVGDRVLRVGDRDVAGQGQVSFLITVSDVAWENPGPVSYTVDRDGREVTVREERREGLIPFYIGEMVTSLAWGIVGILILLRAPPTRESRFLFYCLAVYALSATSTFWGPTWVTVVSLLLNGFVGITAAPLLILAFLGFPEEARSLTGWNRVWPWFVAAPLGIPDYSLQYAFPMVPETARSLVSPLITLFIAVLLVVLTVNYRKSGPVGKRRVKWVILAVYVGSLISFFNIWQAGWEPPNPPNWLVISDALANLTFPLSLLIAVERFDLFDIDRLISNTLAYNISIVVVVGVGFILLPPMTAALASGLTIDPAIGQSSVAMALAVIVVVAGRHLSPVFDRMFFQERLALDEALQDLPSKLGSIKEAGPFWETLGTQLQEILKPTTCTIFSATEGAYMPVFSEGDIVPPTLRDSLPIFPWLTHRKRAFRVDRAVIREAGGAVQAVLERVEAQAAVSITTGEGHLEGFISLGSKRSGDIYTDSNLMLLATMANGLPIHLARFTERERLEQALAVQKRMRRYVPRVIADRLEKGHDLEEGEREASVLFADLRGFTTQSEPREPTHIRSMLDRYIEAVSMIVDASGGIVVDVWGDGVMAVFGPALSMEAKEEAAVVAACRLANEIPEIPYDAEGDESLAVGVGVATGTVSIGSIQAGDRLFWSVLGNTTIRADRLQKATKEEDLRAAVLIDATTHARAGDAGRRFERRDDVSLIGREEAETLFALPSS